MAIEETMSQLAHSQVTQSLPSLADSIQGFQLIDSNEEANSVIGVLVGLVGDTCIYIPTIYRKGKIYNMDVMYIPELRQWLPTQDNWITYLKSHKAGLIEAVNTSKDGEAGKSVGEVQLDLPFRQITKAASAVEHMGKKYIERKGMPAILKEAGETIVEEITRAAENIDVPDLGEIIDKCAASDGVALMNTIADYPGVGNVFAQFYSDDELVKLADKLAGKVAITQKNIEDSKPKAAGEVKIVTMASDAAKKLSPESKTKLLREGAVITDTRGLAPTKVYKVKDNTEWGTIDTNGIYEVLKIDGSSVTALVIPVGEMLHTNYDYGKNRLEGSKGALVIPLDDFNKRNVIEVNERPLGQPYPYNMVDIPTAATFKDLSSVITSSDPETGYDYSTDYVLIVTKSGDAIILNNRGEKPVWASDADGEAHVRFDRSVDVIDTNKYGSDYIGGIESKIHAIEELPEGARLRVSGKTLYVPASAYFFPVKRNYRGSNEQGFATVEDIQDSIKRREKLTRVKIFNDNNRITISDESGSSIGQLSKAAAEYTLVKNYLVDPDTATNLVKEASEKSVNQCRYLFKIAADSQFSALINENPDIEKEQESVDLNQVLPEDVRKELETAGQSGVKEVVDVTVLKNLANDGSSIRQVQEFIPRLFTALDAVCRMLFMTRAGTSMEDAYGESRVKDMEEQLVQLVNSLGDMIICLQQGRIDSVSDLLEGPLANSIG